MSERSERGRAVAIVGIGCRFPGGVSDPQSFWRLLVSGSDAVGEIPPSRIDLAHYFDPRPATPGRIMTRRGGFLDAIEGFDAAFFGISPHEAERIDPQQRLMLETAWEALEDAGQDVARLDGSHTGVFVGQWISDFEGRLFADPEAVDFYMTTGSGRYAASGRISYAFGLRGPSLTLDTACSSSLAAVHLAAQSIRAGESDLALAGGANVILQPHITIAYSQSRMMAPDGRCKFGDASADGYVRSEGAAMIVLKALDRAIADGDRIYAVLRGSAINNDGRSSGSMGTPSRTGQEELLRAAYRDAGVSPARVRYVEAHGTGTLRGDPVELGALGAVLGEGRAPGQRAFVGSVKTNIGHTEGAAGIAGLIKAVLALHHDTIPASLHCTTPNPAIPWTELPFEVARSQTSWPMGEGLRVAGVSAFGIAGTNAHVVVEESAPARITPVASVAKSRETTLLPLSARSPEALKALAARYADLLEKGESASDVAFSAATKRTAHDVRAAFVGGDGAALAGALRRYVAGEPATADGVVESAPTKVVFVCPGQGAQWVGMGRELAEKEPVFREALDRCEAASRRFVDWSITEQLFAEPGSAGYRLDQIDVIQPVLVALAVAYAALWRSLGVAPDAVIGHSMGEVAAAHLAGVLDLERAMQIICRRSALMRRASGRGAMALVELSMKEAEARIGSRGDRLGVAVTNSPRSSVISGDVDAVDEVLAELERDGVFCRRVKVDVASHSPHMEPLAKELAAELAGMAPNTAAVPIYSTVLGRRAEGRELDASYWGRNLRQPVLFGSTIGKVLEEAAAPVVFVELGPHPVLLTAIEQTAQASGAGKRVFTFACGRREEPEQATLFASLGGLWTRGSVIDWTKALPPGKSVPLPLYPWQRERHWVEAAEIGRARSAQSAGRRVDDESLGWLHELVWKASPIAARDCFQTRTEPDEERGKPGEARGGSLLTQATDEQRSLDFRGRVGRRESLKTVPSSRAMRWLVLAPAAADGAAIAGALSTAGARADVANLDDLEAALESAPDALVVVAAEGADAPWLPLRVLKAVLRGAARPRIWFVTSGSQSRAVFPEAPSPGPEAGKARVSPLQAALWGAARVVAEEHPELWGGLVDRDPAASDAGKEAALLAQQLLSGDGEDQVALRNGGRFVLRLAKVKPEASPVPFAWRTDGAYLVTGGLGDIGLHVARTMAERGVRRLVLVGRTKLPERSEWSRTAPNTPAGQRIQAVRALESSGVAVHTAALDVGDEAELRAFLERYAAEGWPPIVGVIHAAGALDNHLARSMERSAFDGIVGPKLGGAVLLDRLLPDVDLFVSFSSTGAFLAQAGQANYAAANAGLDALAHDRVARGQSALSIDWGVWAKTGLVRGDAGEQNVAEMARQGIGSFSPERATALFDWLLGRKTAASIVVLPIDYASFRRARAARDLPLFRDLLGEAPVAEAELGSRLEGASLAERRQLVESVVREALGKVLKIAPARIDAKKTLGSMGLSSLLSMELRNRLETALGRALSTTLVFNHPTVAALVDHLAGAAEAPAPSGPAHETVTPVAEGTSAEHLRQIVELSDEEAALALRSRRSRRTP